MQVRQKSPKGVVDNTAKATGSCRESVYIFAEFTVRP